MSVLLPSNLLGNVLVNETSFTLSMGASDRAASSLGLFTAGDREFLKPYGTEGSLAKWEVENGTYEVTYKVYSFEDQSDRDTIVMEICMILTLLVLLP